MQPTSDLAKELLSFGVNQVVHGLVLLIVEHEMGEQIELVVLDRRGHEARVDDSHQRFIFRAHTSPVFRHRSLRRHLVQRVLVTKHVAEASVDDALQVRSNAVSRALDELKVGVVAGVDELVELLVNASLNVLAGVQVLVTLGAECIKHFESVFELSFQLGVHVLVVALDLILGDATKKFGQEAETPQPCVTTEHDVHGDTEAGVFVAGQLTALAELNDGLGHTEHTKFVCVLAPREEHALLKWVDLHRGDVVHDATRDLTEHAVLAAALLGLVIVDDGAHGVVPCGHHHQPNCEDFHRHGLAELDLAKETAEHGLQNARFFHCPGVEVLNFLSAGVDAEGDTPPEGGGC